MRTSATGNDLFLSKPTAWGGRPRDAWWRGDPARDLPLHRPADGPPPYRFATGRTGGFTLIELLVVLAIIGMLSAAVVLAIPDPRGSLTAEAERFAARAEAAQERAILDARVMALRVDATGYAFERREGADWQALADRPFAPQRWTEGTSASSAGRITFDPTGVSEPATLTLRREGERVTVEIGQDGAVRVRA